MEIPAYKKKWFEEAAAPPILLQTMDEFIAAFDEDARRKDAPRKAKEVFMGKNTQPVEEVEKAEVPPEEEEEEEKDMMNKALNLDAFRKEIADAVVEVVDGIQASMTQEFSALTTRIQGLEKEVKELRATDAEKLSRQREEVPPASLAAVIQNRLQKSNAGNMQKDDPLHDRRPVENVAPAGNNGYGTGVGVLDSQIRSNRQRRAGGGR